MEGRREIKLHAKKIFWCKCWFQKFNKKNWSLVNFNVGLLIYYFKDERSYLTLLENYLKIRSKQIPLRGGRRAKKFQFFVLRNLWTKPRIQILKNSPFKEFFECQSFHLLLNPQDKISKIFTRNLKVIEIWRQINYLMSFVVINFLHISIKISLRDSKPQFISTLILCIWYNKRQTP